MNILKYRRFKRNSLTLSPTMKTEKEIRKIDSYILKVISGTQSNYYQFFSYLMSVRHSLPQMSLLDFVSS